MEDSLSDNSEELFQTNKGGVRIHKSFFPGKQNKKKNHVVKQRLLLITKHRNLKLIILVLLYVWEVVIVCMCVLSCFSHVQLFATL